MTLSRLMLNIADAYWLDGVKQQNTFDRRQANIDSVKSLMPSNSLLGQQNSEYDESKPVNYQAPASDIVAATAQDAGTTWQPDVEMSAEDDNSMLPFEANMEKYQIPRKGNYFDNATAGEIAEFGTRLNGGQGAMDTFANNRRHLEEVTMRNINQAAMSKYKTDSGRSGKLGNNPIAITNADGSLGYIQPNSSPGEQHRQIQLKDGQSFAQKKEIFDRGDSYLALDEYNLGHEPGAVSIEKNLKQHEKIPYLSDRQNTEASNKLANDYSASGQKAKQAADILTAEAEAKRSNKLIAERPQVELSYIQQDQKNDRVTDAVDRALDNSNVWTTGYGGLLSGLPSSDAKKLDNDIKTIRSVLTLDTLKDIKSASSTGGTGMGATNQIEFEQLISNVAVIDQSTSVPELHRALNGIKDFFSQQRVNRQEFFRGTYGDEAYEKIEQRIGGRKSDYKRIDDIYSGAQKPSEADIKDMTIEDIRKELGR